MSDLLKSLRDAAECGALVPGLKDQPERRYTYGGHVAHLLTYGIDYSSAPYASAWCNYSPEWGAPWLGSGSQRERDMADKLPTCKRCLAVARESAEFLAGLAAQVTTEDDR